MKQHGIYARYIKRMLDFIVALFAILLLSPLLIITALIVRIGLGSPIIFKQQRPGKDGVIFNLYKFRTMRDAADIETGKRLNDEERLRVIAEKGDEAVTSDAERLTKLGRILRATSLDELPELFNILKGEMSIVGPRPLATIYLPYYNEEERHRHDVTPGLTGWAQVNGRNALSWEKRFAYDLEYVNNISFLMDMKVLFKTVAVVFKRSDVAQGEQKPEAFNVVRQREWDEQRLPK